MKEFKVIIPDENYLVINFRQEDLPGLAVVNSALRNFEPKDVFPWHLSIMVELKDLVDNGMPSKTEIDVLDKYKQFLDDKIKGGDKEKPNALFLARITWNGTREFIWRVYDPEIANKFLNELIDDGNPSREFDYRMDNDEQWQLAEWNLRQRD